MGCTVCGPWWGCALVVRASGMFITGVLLVLVLACPVCLGLDPQQNWRICSWFRNNSCGDSWANFSLVFAKSSSLYPLILGLGPGIPVGGETYRLHQRLQVAGGLACCPLCLWPSLGKLLPGCWG